jgi:hypothetical protein
MNTITLENNQAEMLARAIDCHQSGLPLDVARFMVSLGLAEDDERRMNELAQKSADGHLTEVEEAELEEFRRFGRLMEMLKLKSRKVLQAK